MSLQRFEDYEKDTIRLVGVPVVYGDRPGRNKNVYSSDVLRESVPWWEKMVQLDPTYKYSLIKHPKDTTEESLENVAGMIERIYFDETKKCLFADFKLLPTKWGLLVSYFSKRNYPIGVSLRGDAEPSYQTMTINGKQMSVTMRKNLKLEGVDFVLYPSFMTTQISSEHVTESRKVEKIYKVMEGFKKEYKNILKDDEIDKLNNLYTQCGGTNMNKDDITKNTSDVDAIALEIEKKEVQKDRLTVDIDKLENTIAKTESKLEDLSSKTETATSELEELNKNINDSKSELDALLQTKKTYESEIEAKTAALEELKASIETKTTESAELDELNALKNKSTNTEVTFKKSGKVFDSENSPTVRIVEPKDRIAKMDWNSVDADEIKKIAYLNGEMDSCFAHVNESTDGFNKYEHPVYQAFPSEEDGVDFDMVLNVNALNSISELMQSKAAIAIDTDVKKEVCKYVLDRYTALDEIGQGSAPEFLSKVTESTISFKTEKPYLDALLEGLLTDNIIDLDASELIEKPEENNDENNEENSDETDEKTNDSVIVAIDNEKTEATLREIGQTLSKILGSDNSEEDNSEENKQPKLDGNQVVEQFNPADETLDVKSELTEFVDLLLANDDGSKTPFSETYDLKNGSDVYAMYGVIKDSLTNADFATALQILKGLTGTIYVNIKNSDQVDVQSTEQVEPTDDMDIDKTPETEPVENSKLKLTDVQIINYAFNMSTLILARYDEVKEIFDAIQGEEPAPEPEQEEPAPMPDENIDTNEQTTENNTVFENTNDGGVEMDASKLIEMLNENFDIQEELNEENVLDAVGSIITDFVDVSEKYSNLEKEIESQKVTEMKKNYTKELCDLGVEEDVITKAFEELNSEEEITAKYEELKPEENNEDNDENKVTESTDKVTLKRKGTANPEDIVVEPAKDNFDKLMSQI